MQLMGVEEDTWVGAMRKGALKRRNVFAAKADVASYMRSRYAFKVCIA